MARGVFVRGVGEVAEVGREGRVVEDQVAILGEERETLGHRDVDTGDELPGERRVIVVDAQVLERGVGRAERQQDLGSASYCCGPNAGM